MTDSQADEAISAITSILNTMKPPKPKIKTFLLRLPVPLKKELTKSAKKNNLSLHKEILHRLEAR